MMEQIVLILLLIATTLHYTNTLQIAEKSNDKNEFDRFEPNWDSLDARQLPQWYEKMESVGYRQCTFD